jgi:S-formylglutathione hydrolase FrmB
MTYATVVLRRKRSQGDAPVENRWGPAGDPRWAEHDAYLNSEGVGGKALYLTSRERVVHHTQIVAGGAIEAAAQICTTQLVDHLDRPGIPVTADLGSSGTHSWRYWEDDLRNSWPTLAASMGLEIRHRSGTTSTASAASPGPTR